jgi:hypothetical protein
MDIEEQAKLEALFESGYLIKISAGMLVDGEVTGIYPDEEKEGQWLYDSEVFSGRPLSDVSSHEVEVYAPAIKQWPAMRDGMDMDRLDKWENKPEDSSSITVGGFDFEDYAGYIRNDMDMEISDKEIQNLMEYSSRKLYDASVGMSWDVLESHVNLYFQMRDSGELV